ncbi:carbon monoxide dehydrogenase subunit G [Comamonas sp. w2-DMI]|uniref:CoxG family protein n=1 Tax=Comamonas sp. w2-DMI TaxID=3126391 RepID=UPI0032E38A1A
MEMRASRPLAVSQPQAWEALNDPQALKACLAGCEKFEPAEDGGYSVVMAVRIGPVSARFNGKIVLSDVVPPESYTIAFEGQGGVAGFGKGQAHVRLAPDPEEPGDAQRCLLAYEVQAQVGGKIAQLGQRLIDGAARNMADDFFARFDALLQQRHPVQDIDDALAAVPADEIDADEVDTRSWEYDAANAATTPLDAAPVTPPHEKSGLPLWTWALALVLVLGVVWLLMK